MSIIANKFRQLRYGRCAYAFTMVEIIIVVVIMAIAAMMVVPMFSSAGSIQLSSAANTVAADLEYAKSLAISKGQNYSVVFDTDADSYLIADSDGTTIAHEIKKGFDYIVSFGSGSYLDKVGITTAVFEPGPSSTISFDYLGCPYSGSGTALNSGIITLGTGTSSITISVEPVTGFITISE